MGIERQNLRSILYHRTTLRTIPTIKKIIFGCIGLSDLRKYFYTICFLLNDFPNFELLSINYV